MTAVVHYDDFSLNFFSELWKIKILIDISPFK